jgi:hypothetical protein
MSSLDDNDSASSVVSATDVTAPQVSEQYDASYFQRLETIDTVNASQVPVEERERVLDEDGEVVKIKLTIETLAVKASTLVAVAESLYQVRWSLGDGAHNEGQTPFRAPESAGSVTFGTAAVLRIPFTGADTFVPQLVITVLRQPLHGGDGEEPKAVGVSVTDLNRYMPKPPRVTKSHTFPHDEIAHDVGNFEDFTSVHLGFQVRIETPKRNDASSSASSDGDGGSAAVASGGGGGRRRRRVSVESSIDDGGPVPSYGGGPNFANPDFSGHGGGNNNDDNYNYNSRNPFDWERYAPVLLVAGAALLFIALLLLIVLIATSFTPVDRQHLGVRYNPHTGRIDDSEVFENGHHFWSPAARALQYPSTWRRVQLSRQELEVAVTSGQVLRLACEFRYSFKKSTLIPIVRTFSTLEEKAVRAAAIGALKNAAPGFTFEQYVTDRDAVTDGLHAAVGAGLLAAGIDVTLPRPGFILGFVELPATVLALNQAVFFQAEAQIRNEFEKQAAIVRLATQTNESLINATAEAVRAGAEATRTQLRAVAAHRGTAQLRSETGRLVKALAGRLGVATAAGHGALAEYSLLLAAVEGTVSTISPTPVEDAAAANAANATASGNNTSGETASAYARSFTLLDGDAAALGMTPLV